MGFVVPAMVATGVGLLRRHPAAVRAAYGLAAFATCLAGSVAGMAVAMEAKGDPSSQPAMLAVVLPATLGLAVVTWRLLRSYQGATSERLRVATGPRLDQRVRKEPA